jgi:hypothetical protein
METYIALLLLVVPGFIAKYIYGKLDHQIEVEDKFENIINSLIFNVFILLLNYFVLDLFGFLSGAEIKDVTILFNSVNFILGYTLLTLITAIAVAVIWDKSNPFYMKLINKYRETENRNCILRDTVLASSFNDGKSHLISIEKDDKELFRGLILHIDSEKKEMYIEAMPDIHLITEVKGKYFDFDKNIQITEYAI